MPQEETFEIGVGLANSILQYLNQRPYNEVANMIHQIQAAAKLSIENKKNEVLPPATPPAPAPAPGQEGAAE